MALKKEKQQHEEMNPEEARKETLEIVGNDKVKKKEKNSQLVNKIVMYVLLCVFLFISIFPFYWMFVGSTNHTSKIFTNPPTLTFGDQFLINFTNLNNAIGIYRVLFNSLFVSLTFVVLSLAVCTLAAYALSKFQFKGLIRSL
ncbi:hypothetical protein [Halalkalibacter urbisdiaboli]|uniref:hypothetical protein n=1 Tax=Halalkalibacter urbisdiaboli TaxID=1960589 RepID=UPI003159F483